MNFMSARLCISTEEGVVLDLRLGGQPVRIGRAKNNTIKSEDRRTSRQHAIVRRLPDGAYQIEDAGSSYGTMLNGRLVKQELLKAQDMVRCGGLTLQFLDDPSPDDEVDQSLMSSTMDGLNEARAQIKRMIEEHAVLRSEVGNAQEAEDRAKRLRDEAQDETEGLHKLLATKTADKEALQQRVNEMGQELRELLSRRSDSAGEAEGLRKQLGELQKASERQVLRISVLEERDSVHLATELGLKKEAERLAEQLKKRDQRELELTAALKPALLRIAEISRELEQTRIQLAKAEIELGDLRRGSSR
jgi:pSer/pThr/pTyr-binding forkhead associated (FHA) protein